MANLTGFDANQVEPNKALEPLPTGWYDVIIVSSEMKPNSKGTGSLLALELQVINGPHQNRKLYDNLNIINPSEQAVQIAKGTLSAICRAVGVLTPKDSTELHGKPLRARAVIKKTLDGNDVKGYEARQVGGGAAYDSQGATTNQQEAVGAGAASKSPW